MGEKAEYRSAIRSRRLIRQAFAELLQEKGLEKITVSDIVAKADINRGTFYAHFADTRAVIEQLENETIEKMVGLLNETQYQSFIANPYALLTQFSRYLEEDGLHRILINSKGSGLFVEKLKNIFVRYFETTADIKNNMEKSKQFLIRVNFVAGGIVNLYQIWLRGDMKITSNEISLEIGQLINSNLDFIYKNKE